MQENSLQPELDSIIHRSPMGHLFSTLSDFIRLTLNNSIFSNPFWVRTSGHHHVAQLTPRPLATLLQQTRTSRGAPIMKDLERDVLRKTILELVKKGHVLIRILRKKRSQHAYASQHQTPLENSSITIFSRKVMWSESDEESTRLRQKEKNY